jgi:hypothetical protein
MVNVPNGPHVHVRLRPLKLLLRHLNLHLQRLGITCKYVCTQKCLTLLCYIYKLLLKKYGGGAGIRTPDTAGMNRML